MYKVVWAASLFLTTAALAESPLSMSGRDFMVDWPSLIGKTVHVTGG